MAGSKRKAVLSRRFHPMITKLVKGYNTNVGTLIWAWNRLHGILGEAFCRLATPDDLGLGRAIWHSIASDAGQRDMLQAVLENCDRANPKSAEALEWIMAVMAAHAPNRNDIAHTPMSHAINLLFNVVNLVVDPVKSKPQSAERMRNPKIRQFHRHLLGDLTVLFYYGEFALQALSDKSPQGWPQMPRLKSFARGSVPLSRSQNDRRQQQQLKRQQMKARRGPLEGKTQLSKRQRRDARIAAAKAKMAQK